MNDPIAGEQGIEGAARPKRRRARARAAHVPTDRERKEQALARFMVAAVLICLAIAVEPLLEIVLFYMFGVVDAWTFGRNAMFAIADTSLSADLMKGIGGIVTLALAVLARPRKRVTEWKVLIYGSMVALGCCLVMIVLYRAVGRVIDDIPDITMAAEKYPSLVSYSTSDADKNEIISKIANSISALYTGLGIWFAGLVVALSRTPKSDASPPARAP